MQNTTTGKDILASIIAMHQLFVVVALFKNYIMILRHKGNLIKIFIFFCEICWLSRGSVLARLNELRNEFASFLKNKNINITAF